MLLENRIVRCNKCGAKFLVTNPNKVEVLKIRCLNGECTNDITVIFNDGKTTLPSNAILGSTGKFIISTQEIPLDDLINQTFTFGRATPNIKEKPDVGIVTADTSMSRIHCNVEIRKLASGSIKTIISDARIEEKITICALEVNGIKLSPIDKVVLCDGDNIKMGSTIVRYHQK